MLISKLDVDDVTSWLGGAVGDLTGAVLLVLRVDVHLAGAFDGQAQAAVAWTHVKVRDAREQPLPLLVSEVPASRVSMMNSAGSKVLASLRPGPLTRTRLASPISDSRITTEMGLLGMWRPLFLMFTRCSPTSLGTKEMPGTEDEMALDQ